MRNDKRWLGSLVALALAACGGHADEHSGGQQTAAGSEHPEPAADVELHNACVLMMHRERECSDQFIPALVSLRARMDHPTGFAARDAADHAGLVSQATDEYRRDATDERIAATCTDTSRLPRDHTSGWVPQISSCVAMTDCQAFVECDMHFTEARFSDRSAHDAAHPPASEGGTARPVTAPAPASTGSSSTTPPPSSTTSTAH